jgi:hypothetical protein
MNKAACVLYAGVFLALPPVLLLTRLFDKARMPWVLLLAVSVIVGWLLGPVYLIPWLFLYCVFIFGRWMLASRAR